MRFGAGRIAEGRDHVAESKESAIDGDTFLDTLTLSSRALQLLRISDLRSADAVIYLKGLPVLSQPSRRNETWRRP